jgi:hypothetical protein
MRASAQGGEVRKCLTRRYGRRLVEPLQVGAAEECHLMQAALASGQVRFHLLTMLRSHVADDVRSQFFGREARARPGTPEPDAQEEPQLAQRPEALFTGATGCKVFLDPAGGFLVKPAVLVTTQDLKIRTLH